MLVDINLIDEHNLTPCSNYILYISRVKSLSLFDQYPILDNTSLIDQDTKYQIKSVHAEMYQNVAKIIKAE